MSLQGHRDRVFVAFAVTFMIISTNFCSKVENNVSTTADAGGLPLFKPFSTFFQGQRIELNGPGISHFDNNGNEIVDTAADPFWHQVAATANDLSQNLDRIYEKMAEEFGLAALPSNDPLRKLIEDAINTYRTTIEKPPGKMGVTNILGFPGTGKTSYKDRLNQLLVDFHLLRSRANIVKVQMIEGQPIPLGLVSENLIDQDVMDLMVEYARLAPTNPEAAHWLNYLQAYFKVEIVIDESGVAYGMAATLEQQLANWEGKNPKPNIRQETKVVDGTSSTIYLNFSGGGTPREISFEEYRKLNNEWSMARDIEASKYRKWLQQLESETATFFDASALGTINSKSAVNPLEWSESLTDAMKELNSYRATNIGIGWKGQTYKIWKSELNDINNQIAAISNASTPDETKIKELIAQKETLESRLLAFKIDSNQIDNFLAEYDNIVANRNRIVSGILGQFPELGTSINARLDAMLTNRNGRLSPQNLPQHIKDDLDEFGVEFLDWATTMRNSSDFAKANLLLEIDQDGIMGVINTYLSSAGTAIRRNAAMANFSTIGNLLSFEQEVFEQAAAEGALHNPDRVHEIAVNIWNAKHKEYTSGFISDHFPLVGKFKNEQAYLSRMGEFRMIFPKKREELIAITSDYLEKWARNIERRAGVALNSLKIDKKVSSTLVDGVYEALGSLRAFFPNVDVSLAHVKERIIGLLPTSPDMVLTFGGAGSWNVYKTPSSVPPGQYMVDLVNNFKEEPLIISMTAPVAPLNDVPVESILTIERRAQRLADEVYIGSFFNGSAPIEIDMGRSGTEKFDYALSLWNSPNNEDVLTWVYNRNQILMLLAPDAELEVIGRNFKPDEIVAASNEKAEKKIIELIMDLETWRVARHKDTLGEVIPQALRDTPVFKKIIVETSTKPIDVEDAAALKDLAIKVFGSAQDDVANILKEAQINGDVTSQLAKRLVDLYNAKERLRSAQGEAAPEQVIKAAQERVEMAVQEVRGARIVELIAGPSSESNPHLPDGLKRFLIGTRDQGQFGATMDGTLDIFKDFYAQKMKKRFSFIQWIVTVCKKAKGVFH